MCRGSLRSLSCFILHPFSSYSPLSALILAQRAFAASFSFFRVACETLRFFLAGDAVALVMAARLRAGLAGDGAEKPIPGISLASSRFFSVKFSICASIPAIASLIRSDLLLPTFGLGMSFSFFYQ